jgi:hypothetical protein
MMLMAATYLCDYYAFDSFKGLVCGVRSQVSALISFAHRKRRHFFGGQKRRRKNQKLSFVHGKAHSRPGEKVPETPDEWRGRVSPVHVFPRFRFSNGTTRQNFAGFLKTAF